MIQKKLPRLNSFISTWDMDIDTLLQLFEFIKKLKGDLFIKFENSLKSKKCAIFSDYETIKKQFGPSASFTGLQLKEFPLQNDNIAEELENLKKENINLIIIKTNKSCFAQYVKEYTSIPLINAGDGKTENPVTAIRDLFTIYEKVKKIENLKIGFFGDITGSDIFRSILFILMKTTCYCGVFTHPLLYQDAFNSLGVRYFYDKKTFLEIKWDFLFFLGLKSDNMLFKDESVKQEYERFFKMCDKDINTFLIVHNDTENLYSNNERAITKELEANEFFSSLAVLLMVLHVY